MWLLGIELKTSEEQSVLLTSEPMCGFGKHIFLLGIYLELKMLNYRKEMYLPYIDTLKQLWTLLSAACKRSPYTISSPALFQLLYPSDRCVLLLLCVFHFCIVSMELKMTTVSLYIGFSLTIKKNCVQRYNSFIIYLPDIS